MKKLICIILLLSLLLVSCGADPELIRPVQEAFSDTEYNDYSFTLRVELGKKCVLLASGDISVTESPLLLTGEIEETFLGEDLGIMQISWEDGVLTTDGEEEAVSWEELHSSLMYASPLLFDEDEVKKTESGTTISGVLYRHYIKDNSQSQTLYALLGEALPELCGVVSVIQDETEFKDIVCEYTLSSDGTPVSYAISFTVSYQDTPPYVPGVTQDKDKYTVEVGIEYRLTYSQTP